ncbi:MAG: IS5 family transposase [Oscillospiraceae bacterium]
MHNYSSDITREQFEMIREELESAKKKTRSRKVDLYDVFCAVMYIIKGGIQWRMLPSDFPDWKLVYYYFTVWSKEDENGINILDKVLKKIVQIIRNNDLRKSKMSLGIIDSQSIKNINIPEEKGYDGNKKILGIKRHIIVDTMGLPHAIMITTANTGDRDGAIKMVMSNLENLSNVKKFLVDGGYIGDKFSDTIKEICGAEVEVIKRGETHKFIVLPKRWIVERTFGWINHYRRLWKNCERFLKTSYSMLVLSFISIFIKRF